MLEKKEVHLIGFSHLDLFWGGTREECLSRGCRIIRTGMDLLEKNEDYRFLIESCNFLETFLDCFPEEKMRMQRLISAGRLEIIPMRSIIYSHLPAGETTVRNLLYGQDFCRRELGCEPKIMSMSDIPGVIAQLPQIAKLAGMTEIVLSRGFRRHTDHVLWRAPDGTEIRAYCPWHYASLAGILSSESYETMISGKKTFEEYVSETDDPQIIHWGMDLYVLSPKILENIHRWNKDGHRFLHFSTFREFFDKYQDVPFKEMSGELPSTWPHIESSWPDLWPLDVPAENAMRSAELLGAFNLLAGFKNDYPAGEMKQAWLNLLDSIDHNQNGIGGTVADRDKLRLKLSAQMTAEQCTDRFLWRFASRVNAPHADAAPVVVFNPLSWKRSGLATVRTACYGNTFACCYNGSVVSSDYYKKHEFRPFRLIDSEGNELPVKVETHLCMLTDTVEFTFPIREIPAFGCKTYFIERLKEPAPRKSVFTIHSDREEDRKNASRCAGSDSVENAFFKLEIHRVTGELTLFDKKHGRIVFERAGIIGLEELRGEYIYNMALSGRIMPAIIDSIEITENNDVYCRVEIQGSVYQQRFIQRITIAAEFPEIDLENIIDWNEKRYVRIEQNFPFVSKEKGEIQYGAPFGRSRYPETMYQTAEKADDVYAEQPSYNIRLVNGWVDIGDSISGVTIASDHRMWSFDGNTMRGGMVRGIGWTSGGFYLAEDGTQSAVQRPPKGEYRFHFRIVVRDGNISPDGRAGWELNAPVLSSASATGFVSSIPGIVLPEMPDTTDSSVIVSWVKPSEDGSRVVFRCYESLGREAVLRLPENARYKWFETDFTECNLTKAGPSAVFRPWEIKTFVLEVLSTHASGISSESTCV